MKTTVRLSFLAAFIAVVVGDAMMMDPEKKFQETLKREENSFKKCHDGDKNIYGFEVETLDGQKKNLSEYKGKVVLVVNVATFCRYTRQYLDFNGLMERNGGVELLAFPANQHHLQEPGRNNEILHGLKYVRPGNGWTPNKNVHIYGKLEVNGKTEHPLYTFLKSTCPGTIERIGERETMFWDPIKANDIVWNFEKFLVDKRGRPRIRFHPAAWQNGTLVEKHMAELMAEE